MPAVISAIFSAIYAALAKKDDYKSTLEDIFPAMTDPQQIGANATGIILGVSLFELYFFDTFFLNCGHFRLVVCLSSGPLVVDFTIMVFSIVGYIMCSYHGCNTSCCNSSNLMSFL